MNIIIANKFREQLKTINVEVIKELFGQFDASEITSTLENIYFEHIIIDITAIKNNDDITNLQKLSASFDMSKVILLLDNDSRFLTQKFISSIISVGIYNFTKNIDGVKYLLSNPNSYGDVAKYHVVNVESNSVKEEKVKEKEQTRKYNSVDEIYASTELTPAEKDEMITRIRMQEQVKKAKIGGENSKFVRNKNTKFRIVLTFIILPVVLYGLTYGYHFFLYTLDNWIDANSSVGKVFFGEIFEGGPTYSIVIASLILLPIIFLISKMIDVRIKGCKSLPLKFSLIPFGIIIAVFNIDKYFITFLDKAFYVGNLDFKLYMENDIYMNFRYVFYLFMSMYYLRVLFSKFKSVEFESEIGNKTTVLEKIVAIIFWLVIYLPVLHGLFNTFNYVEFITDIFNNIMNIKYIMEILSILQIIGVISLIVIAIINRYRLTNEVEIAQKK